MNFEFNLADFFKLPTRIMSALSLASGMILFLPDNIVEKIYMTKFRANFGFIIGLVFIVSVSILLVTLIISSYSYIHHKRFMKRFKAKANENLQKLDEYQKAIIYGLYLEINHTDELPIYDGSVKWLEQNMMITKTTNQYAVSDLNNAVFPYMLQPWVIEELQKDNDLIPAFKNAFNHIEAKTREEQQQYNFYSSDF